MKVILHLFWQICLLRQSPAYVPTRGWFVASIVAANILCSTLVSTGLGDVDLISTVTSILVGQATTAALVMLALALRNVTDRFVTTVTAIFGCDLLITACFALLLPFSAMLSEGTLTLALLGFLIWSIAVAGFILQQALQSQLIVGIGVAMAISLMSLTVSSVAIGQ